MPTIIEFTVPSDAFPLGQIFQEFSDAIVEFECVIPTTEAYAPYFWMWGSEVEAIPTLFRGHPAISTISMIDTVSGGGLFAGEWDLAVDSLLTGIVNTGVTVLSATGSQNGWEFQLRAVDSDAITQFQHYWRDHEISITITRLYALSEMRTGDAYKMTDTQEEALTHAFEAGYYDTPREASLKEIGQELGISRQALAKQLRHGYRNLIGTTLMHGANNQK